MLPMDAARRCLWICFGLILWRAGASNRDCPNVFTENAFVLPDDASLNVTYR